MDICNEIQDLISSYIDGELSPEEATRVSEHIILCEECANELKLLREVVAGVKTLPQQDLPPGFHKKLMKNIRAGTGAFSPRKRFPGERRIRKLLPQTSYFSFRKYIPMAAGVLIMFTALSVIGVGLDSMNSKPGGTVAGSGQLSTGSSAETPSAVAFSAEASSDEAYYGAASSDVVYLAEDSSAEASKRLNDKDLILADEGAKADESGELMMKTYNIELLVEDFELALNVIENLPGYNSQSSETMNRNGEGWAWISRRVDEGSYTMTKSVLQSMGKVLSADESLERVTAENMDAEVRLAAKEEEAARLLALLGSSKTMDVLTLLESRLGQVENEIDMLKGRLNYYSAQSGQPYINITLRVESPTVIIKESFGERVGRAYASSVNGTLSFMEAFLVTLSTVSVPAVIFVLFLLCLWFARKKIRKRRAPNETDM